MDEESRDPEHGSVDATSSPDWTPPYQKKKLQPVRSWEQARLNNVAGMIPPSPSLPPQLLKVELDLGLLQVVHNLPGMSPLLSKPTSVGNGGR